jgi:hypothetical protein
VAQALGELLGSRLVGVDGALQVVDGRERGVAERIQAAVDAALQAAPQWRQRQSAERCRGGGGHRRVAPEQHAPSERCAGEDAQQHCGGHAVPDGHRQRLVDVVEVVAQDRDGGGERHTETDGDGYREAPPPGVPQDEDLRQADHDEARDPDSGQPPPSRPGSWSRAAAPAGPTSAEASSGSARRSTVSASAAGRPSTTSGPTRKLSTPPPRRASSTTSTTTPRGYWPCRSVARCSWRSDRWCSPSRCPRARTVPRWVPVLGVLTAITGIVIPPDTVAGIIAEAASSATTVALGWYAWRRPATS